MLDLLKSDNILAEPRVNVAYWGLMPCIHDYHRDGFGRPLVCSKCKTIKHEGGHCPITCSIYEAAFRMRDACVTKDIGGKKHDWKGNIVCQTGHLDTYNLLLSEPIHWIVAATLAWEAKGGGDE